MAGGWLDDGSLILPTIRHVLSFPRFAAMKRREVEKEKGGNKERATERERERLTDRER